MIHRNPPLDDHDSTSGSPRVRPLCTTADADTPEAQAAIAAAFPEPGPDDLASLAIGPDLRAALIDAGVRTVGDLRMAFDTLTYLELRERLGVSDTEGMALWAALESHTAAAPVPQADPVSPLAKTAPAAVPSGPTPFESLVRIEVTRQVELRRPAGRGEKLSLIEAWSDLDDATRFLYRQADKRDEDRDLARIRTVLVGVAALAQRAAEDLGLVARAGDGEEER
jgi:hypothetical protein